MNVTVNIYTAFLIFAFQGITSPLESVMIVEIANRFSVDTAIIGYAFTLWLIGGFATALLSRFISGIIIKYITLSRYRTSDFIFYGYNASEYGKEHTFRLFTFLNGKGRLV